MREPLWLSLRAAAMKPSSLLQEMSPNIKPDMDPLFKMSRTRVKLDVDPVSETDFLNPSIQQAFDPLAPGRLTQPCNAPHDMGPPRA